jgi:hypothetical protein
MMFPPPPVQHPAPSAPHAAPPSGPTGVPQPQGGPHAGPTAPYQGGVPYAASSEIPQPASGPSTQRHSGPSFGQPAFGASGPVTQDPAFTGSPPPPTATASFQGQAGSVWDTIDELPGSQFVKFLKISARRAFRLRIDPHEVLPSERRTLLAANPPIVDSNLQAFLSWRRSVLFLVACALIPLTLLGLIDSYRSRDWQAIFFVRFAPAFAELIFLYVCWTQLKTWAQWRSQRRKLFYGWLVFMLTPFLVFVYPLNTFFTELRAAATNAEERQALLMMGISGAYKKAVMPFVFSMLAMLQLAPKAISLMPGLIRSSMVIKLLFPGSSAPGWLIVMASPMYALLAYVILIIPYQFTGSGWFIAGVLGVIVAQSMLARAGFALARPLSDEEALYHIKKVRKYYVAVMIISGVLIVIALSSLVSKLNLRATDVILAVLKFETNVLILTMIGADLVVTNLDKARHNTQGRDHVEDATEHKIAAFVSFEAPPPPPPGPAS